MRVVIAGCGYVGSALGRRLVEAGHRVWGVRRSAVELPEGVQALQADLRAAETLRPLLPPDLDAVVFAASAGQRGEAAYRSCYVDGLRGLLGALGGHRLQRLVFVSSTAVYGQDDGSPVDESSPTLPTAFSGRVMLEAERIALASPHPSSVLRFGGIYGPGRTRLIDSVREGKATWDPSTPHWTNRIHRDDGATTIHRLLDLGDAAPARLVVVDDEPSTRETVFTWLAERLGVEPPAPEPESSGTPGGATGKRCSNRRLRALGIPLRYPSFREGYGDMIDG